MLGAMPPPAARRTGLARALSKLGLCSRTQAAEAVRAGRVRLRGVVTLDPEAPTREGDAIELDGVPAAAVERVYLALNKPRGLVTTLSDERGRETVFACLRGAALPAHLAPVGRLDKASEGLLLFTNDSLWAARLTDPGSKLPKVYHVQVDRPPDEALVARVQAGMDLPGGERLGVSAARVLRAGERHGWLEITLEEGRNRHLRRLLAALDLAVLRLLRVAVGPLALGDLAKGAWRALTPGEVAALRQAASPGPPAPRRR